MSKTVWITGASSGIGREFARRYARLGFRLILTARRTDRLEALAAELTVKYNTFCRILPADLEQEGPCGKPSIWPCRRWIWRRAAAAIRPLR